MKWFSIASERPRLSDAAEEVGEAIRSQLGDAEPHLAVVFASRHHLQGHTELAELLGTELPKALLIGCCARSVIGGGRELEERPGLSVTVAHLPGVKLSPFHLEADDLPSPKADASEWHAALGLSALQAPSFVLLPDPFTFDPEHLVRGLDVAFPGSRTIGGLASGGTHPGEHALHLGSRVYRSGVVGVALSGAIEMDTIVAQGCRPIGNPMFITRCRENMLHEIDGRPSVEVLRELYETLKEGDQKLFRTSLFLGIEMKHSQEEYRQGDFLVRNLVGVDHESGALVVGAILQSTQVIQFHLRDAHTSAEDLERRLSRYRGEGRGQPEGALLFSCLGRGMYLYGEPDHDTGVFRRQVGDVALGGFFCNGEIGPVEGKTFLHGYTSSFGIFRSRSS
jgi:small ligand-binding sensory domain FIST